MKYDVYGVGNALVDVQADDPVPGLGKDGRQRKPHVAQSNN